ncbi:MAG: phage portal protein [Bradyrhizobium sp.]|nr:phage portal protein [Bradyrhizobium sp.]
MYDTIKALIPGDSDLPPRARTIDILSRVLDGTIYDVLQYAFHVEYNEAREYIPISQRKPSVRTGMIRTVVDDSVSLLFSEGHFPEISCDDDATKDALIAVTKDAKLNLAMIDAATRGSVGSVAILLRFLARRVFVSSLDTRYLTPAWNPDEPDKLLSVTELRKVTGKQLAKAGYNVEASAETYWFQRVWDASAEMWFQPWKVADDKARPVIDKQRTVHHNLGFVPLVWVKNLPGGDDIDGEPTFGADAINTVMEADYQLSQAGRGLRYSADPTLLLKEPSGTDGQLVRSASNAIVVDKDGDGKLLEINGTASEAVIRYVEKLRELALERLHGNRSSADKLSAAQSGRALELMHQALIWLADKLRASYGEGALLDIYRMVIAGSQRYPLAINGEVFGKLNTGAALSLTWPAWFPPTAADRQTIAQAISSHIDSGTMSAQTGVQTIAADYDIPDVDAELALIDAERKQRMAELPTPTSTITDTE